MPKKRSTPTPISILSRLSIISLPFPPDRNSSGIFRTTRDVLFREDSSNQEILLFNPNMRPDRNLLNHLPSRPGSDMNQTQPKAFKPANPFPVPQRGAFELWLAEAFARLTLFMIIVLGIPFLIWLICLIDVLRNEFTRNNKIVWFLVVFFLPVIGSILYYFIGTDQKIKPGDAEEPVTRLI